MFEKEAEEAGNEKIKENHQFARCARKSYKEGFKDGAEFGYNKAFIEADKNLKAIVTDFNKAKEIIKDYLTIAKGSHTTVCGVPEENRTIYVLKLNKEAEQFLKEID